ncbi:sigma-70 region 4 domain-containing protein [Streptomyces sp. TRM68416]|nr:sigma factor-like helix-turn-helix DNA-binding protein [Streptomyces sp. TRM68416]MBD0843397.1 sigma-70 region 4 domain-containing protein [Streptomyces sp. TRM68416]
MPRRRCFWWLGVTGTRFGATNCRGCTASPAAWRPTRWRARDRADRLGDRIRADYEDGAEPAAEEAVLLRLGAQGVLDRLPAQEQEVLLLVAWDGLSARDTAKVLGCSAGAFKVRLHRARRMLEAAVAEDGAQLPEVGLPVDGRTR